MDGPRAVSSAQDIDWKNDVSFIVASTGIFFLIWHPPRKVWYMIFLEISLHSYSLMVDLFKIIASWQSTILLVSGNSEIQKSDNLQYNMLGRLVDGTNDSLTKRLMFQALFFS